MLATHFATAGEGSSVEIPVATARPATDLGNAAKVAILSTIVGVRCWARHEWDAMPAACRPLHAVTTNLAHRLTEEFDGGLALSFAGRLARRPGWIIIANGFLMSGLTLAYALSPSPLVAVLVSMAFGPPFALRDVAQDSLIQSSVTPELLGRVYALREMFARMAFLIGVLLFSLLADRIGIREIYLIAAFLYLLTALYTLWSVVLRESRIQAATASYSSQ